MQYFKLMFFLVFGAESDPKHVANFNQICHIATYILLNTLKFIMHLLFGIDW